MIHHWQTLAIGLAILMLLAFGIFSVWDSRSNKKVGGLDEEEWKNLDNESWWDRWLGP